MPLPTAPAALTGGVGRAAAEISPSCSAACIRPPGIEQIARGCEASEHTRWRSTAPPPMRPSPRVVLHVAMCQEDLSWLNCSWYSDMRIAIVRKCTREHPGYRRNYTTNILEPRPWAPPPMPRGRCISHLAFSEHPLVARETEARTSCPSGARERARHGAMPALIACPARARRRI